MAGRANRARAHERPRAGVHRLHGGRCGVPIFRIVRPAEHPAADELLQRATDQTLTLTAPPKSFLEEKMTFALFHNRNLTEAWRQQLGESFKRTLEALLPQTWVIDPRRCRRTRPTPGWIYELGAAQGAFAERIAT